VIKKSLFTCFLHKIRNHIYRAANRACNTYIFYITRLKSLKSFFFNIKKKLIRDFIRILIEEHILVKSMFSYFSVSENYK